MIILIAIILILLVFGLPTYPYSKNWGYGPSGLLFAILLVLLILYLVRS